MKRLNPATGLPFKKGDVRENGDIFYQYRKIIKNWSAPYFVEYWLKPELFKKHNFIRRSGENRLFSEIAMTKLKGAKTRCVGSASRKRKATNGKVTITKEWIIERLERGVCEATGDKLTMAAGKSNSPSLDRIDPNNPDYTPENARITTWQFNNMKGAYSDEEFIRVAKQLEKTKKKSASFISDSDNRKSKNSTKSGPILSLRAGENANGAHHHCGADARKDTDCGAKEGSGDDLGHGGAEVGTPRTSKNSQSIRHPEATVDSAKEFFRRVHSESREPSLAPGTASKIRQFGD